MEESHQAVDDVVVCGAKVRGAPYVLPRMDGWRECYTSVVIGSTSVLALRRGHCDE